jgi:hypothetical protein
MWGENEDAILGGDLTAALAVLTPAGGAVLTPVAPIGLRDRGTATIEFTTSLGFGRKLDRISENPRVALAYHAREHGFAIEPHFVLAQGTASYDPHPSQDVLADRVRPASARFLGPPRTGFFWGRWLQAYYADRVLVTVRIERVVSWPDLQCRGEPSVAGTALPAAPPESQSPPKQGVGPRVDVARAARRLRSLPHLLLGYRGADEFPEIVPVALGRDRAEGIELSGPLPPGGRRAGLLGHRYEPQLIGLEVRQHTGWLADSLYAPHTEKGFRSPANKTLLLLANGYMARRGLKRAQAGSGG